jgi:primosomal protein N'
MAYSSDSSDEEGFRDAIDQALGEGDITHAAWLPGRSFQNEQEPETDEEPSGAAGPTKEPLVKMASRAYQLEMLAASLKENVIVAMDTGSGKTQVYVSRSPIVAGRLKADTT